MNITAQMKKWLVENMAVKADATDDEFRKAAGEALANGKLSVETYTKLSAAPETEQARSLDAKFDAIASSLAKLADALVPAKKAESTVATASVATSTEGAQQKAESTTAAKMIAAMGGTPDSTGGEKDSNLRIKRAVEQYDGTKTALHYPTKTKDGQSHILAGERVTEFGRMLDSGSKRDYAMCGVWEKFQILAATPSMAGSPQRAWEMLNDHEKDILSWMVENEEWDDSTNGHLRSRRGYQGGVKQLIDDATSGGLEAAPIVFDDRVIEAPLLFGQLYPLVETVPVERGRRVEGVVTGVITGGWGGIDATAITLFNTAAYVTAYDTTIFRWQGAVQIGLDFLSDTPIDFGAHITRQYGDRLLEDLDDVIAAGNGTTQPNGVINRLGTTVAWGGATSIGNYESVLFGVAPQEVAGNWGRTAVFCGTYTSYQRAMALPVSTTDNRRLANTANLPDYHGFAWMGRAYKINSALTNAQIIYFVGGRYRMYRRRGLTVRTSTEGDTLIRANELLITVTARYGGNLTRTACAAGTTTAPA